MSMNNRDNPRYSQPQDDDLYRETLRNGILLYNDPTRYGIDTAEHGVSMINWVRQKLSDITLSAPPRALPYSKPMSKVHLNYRRDPRLPDSLAGSISMGIVNEYKRKKGIGRTRNNDPTTLAPSILTPGRQRTVVKTKDPIPARKNDCSGRDEPDREWESRYWSYKEKPDPRGHSDEDKDHCKPGRRNRPGSPGGSGGPGGHGSPGGSKGPGSPGRSGDRGSPRRSERRGRSGSPGGLGLGSNGHGGCRHRNHRRHSPSSSPDEWDRGIKMKHPELYDSELDIELFNNWVHSVTNYADIMRICEHTMIHMISECVTGMAKTFYLKHVTNRADKWTYATLFPAMFNYCFPKDFMKHLRAKWSSFTQDNLCVREYI